MPRIVCRPVPAALVCVLWLLSGLPNIINATDLKPPTFPAFTPTGHGPQYPDLANGTVTARPSLEALYLGDRTLDIDGKLDEDIWQEGQLGTGFRQADPNRYTDPSVPTTFKVAYDDDAIYFGVACYEHDMANVSSLLTRRDRLQSSDLVSIYIDPYHDLTTGYNFRINPAGVIQDDYIFKNGNRDQDWNAVWEAETWQDDRGWYLEVRIPFSSIKFKPDDNMTWGLQVYRWLHGRGEDTGWVLWDRETTGFVNRWGTLTGLRDVANPRQLEATPYVALSATDPANEEDDDEAWDTNFNMGADLKYGLTSDLTLNATIQPDFGQVEADPALLNLSPYETWFQEKRPFFIEGARFFQHPNINLFYSRRIGTGEVNSRIRGAAKLTGKLGGDLSVAVLGAATDVAPAGRAHNPFVGGRDKAYYGVARIGKEFSDGDHYINIMGTLVKRDQKPTWEDFDGGFHRDAYSGGVDFKMTFDDRNYQIQGGATGTIVDYKNIVDAPGIEYANKYGTGGAFNFNKVGGNWRYGLNSRWETDTLDANDVGFTASNDMTRLYPWVEYQYNADGDDSPLNHAHINFDFWKTWLYAGRTHCNDDDELLWSYKPGHHRETRASIYVSAQTRNYTNIDFHVFHIPDGTSKYLTRSYDGCRGPLMTVPANSKVGLAVSSDWRKTYSISGTVRYFWSQAGNAEYQLETGLRWNQNQHLTHNISLRYHDSRADAQWLDNFHTPGQGLDDVSYTFANLDQRTWDLTLRTNVLFDRNNSLELYLQPFLTVGDYTNPRYLATPDSYDLRPTDVAASDYDFEYSAVNLNLVYRWEYRPGSTIFVVWAHSRARHEQLGDASEPHKFRNDFDPGFLFKNEPQNVFMLKYSYWFPI